MEESHNPNKEAELADAMQSDQSLSSSSSFEIIQDKTDTILCPEDGTQSTGVIEFNKRKCHLDRSESSWILYIDDIPTELQFKADQNISLETLNNERLYLKVGDNLHIVAISEDGKAKIVPVSGIACTSQTAEEKEPISSLTDNQFEKSVAIRASENNQVKPDLKNIEKDEMCKNESFDQGESLPTVDIDKQHVQIQSLPDGVDDKHTNQAPRHETNYENIKLIKKDKRWILCAGLTENVLDFDENATLTLQIKDEDVYLHADDTLYDVSINPAGEATVNPIQQATVVYASTHCETTTEEQTKRTTVIPTAKNRSDEKMKTNDDNIKLIKKDKHWILCAGLTENVLVFDEKATVTLRISDEDVYLHADDTLYDVSINPAGEATVNQIQQATVVYASTHCEIPTEEQTKQTTVIPTAKNRSDEKMKTSGDNIKLTKKDKHWILCAGQTENVLDFDENATLTLQISDEDVYLQTDDRLCGVSIDPDGKATVTQIQEAIVVSKSILCETATEEQIKKINDIPTAENRSDEKMKTRGDNIKLIKKDTHWILCVGNTENVLDFDGKTTVSLQIRDEDLCLHADDRLYEVSVEPCGKTTVTQIQQAGFISTSTLHESATGAQTQNTNIVPAVKARSGETMQDDLATCSVHGSNETADQNMYDDRQVRGCGIDILKKEKRWVLRVGTVETDIGFDETTELRMEKAKGKLYIHANQQLYEIKIKSSGKAAADNVVIPHSEHGTDSTIGTEDEMLSDAKHSGSQDETVVDDISQRQTFQHDRSNGKAENRQVQDGSIASSKGENTGKSKTPHSEVDDIGELAHMLGDLTLKQDSRKDKILPTLEDRNTPSDKRKCIQITSDDRENSADAKLNEATKIDPHAGNTIWNVSDPNKMGTKTVHAKSSMQPGVFVNRPFSSSLPSLAKDGNDILDDQAIPQERTSDASTFKNSGAIPKQMAKKSEASSSNREPADSQCKKDAIIAAETATTGKETVKPKVMDKDGRDLRGTQVNDLSVHRTFRMDKSEIKNSLSPNSTEKRVGSKQEPIASIAVKVDDDGTFNFIRHSKIRTQLAERNGVQIKSLKYRDCQGFEISGEASAVQTVEDGLKDILHIIDSEKFPIDAGETSYDKTSEQLSRLKSKVEEKFDVFVTFDVHKAKVDAKTNDGSAKVKPSKKNASVEYQSSQRVSGSASDNENDILKIETPKAVSWLFPGGYKIALCNKPVEDTTATAIVKFTKWNGEEKQISSAAAPDGLGGYISNVSIRLPMCNDTEDSKKALNALLARILQKAGEDKKSSIAFSLRDIQNWSCLHFLECLLSAVWMHFKSPNKDKPVFIELCISKSDEYSAANFHCLRLITTEMAKELDCLNSVPLEIELTEGSLHNTKAEVLVNTTSPILQLNAGAVSIALLKTAGVRLQEDCSKYYPRGIDWGEIAVTQGHGLPCTFVFHGALPAYKMKIGEAEKYMAFRSFMDHCLTKASDLGCRTIAFPVLGAGNLKYPVDLVAAEMFTCVERFQQSYKRSTLRAVYFVVYPADKEALRTFRQMQSDLDAVKPKRTKTPPREKSDSGKEKQQTSLSDAIETDKGDDSAVENVKVEITGLQHALKEARNYIESSLRRVISKQEHIFNMCLPTRLGLSIIYGHGEQHDRLKQEIKDFGAEITEIEKKYFILAASFEILQQTFLRIKEYSETNGGRQCVLGEFYEMNVIAEIHRVTQTDFMVMEKMFKTSLNKFEKDGTKIYHEKSCVVIQGKAEKIDPIRNETAKLITYIKKLESCCIDIPETGPETLNSVICELEARCHETCILLETGKGQLRLFSKQNQTLMDLKRELLDKIKVNTSKQTGNSSSKHHQNQSLQEQKTSSPKINKQHTGYSPFTLGFPSASISVLVYEGDLLQTHVDCVVNAANEHLLHNAGVAAAVARAAGPALLKESASYIKRYRKVSAGDIVITTAGDLPYRGVIHGVGPNWRDYQPLTQSKLQECKKDIQSVILKSLDEVNKSKLKSVAIPAISTGYLGVPGDICALQYAEAVKRFVDEARTRGSSIEEIHFVSLNKDVVKQIEQTFKDVFIHKKMINYDSKYLPREQGDTGKMGGPHTGHDSIKLTGRSKPVQQTVPHSSQNVSSSRTDTRVKANATEVKPVGKILPDPVVYQSPSKAIVIQFTTYQELQLYTANILELQLPDAIVVCEDLFGSGKGSIAHGLQAKGGPKYVTEKQKVFRSKLSFGDVIVTSGGDSQFKYVLHALLHHRQHFPQDITRWYDAFRKILRLLFSKAINLKCHSIAMPIIGTDSGMQDITEYARAFIESYKSFCLEKSTQELAVHLISYEPSVNSTLQSLFERHIDNQRKSSSSPASKNPHANDASKPPHKTEKQGTSGSNSSTDNDDCVICLDKVKRPKKLRCGHIFCKDCIDQHLKTKKNCPVCGKVLGKITGSQPPGTMNHDIVPTSLHGYGKCKTIRIVYSFTSGTQGAGHPEPGKNFSGISRIAFLPDNDEGRQILKLLQVAFDRKLTFTIGQSRTTGQSGVITWNDIHHKTNSNPNTQFGYPDPTYFDRVKDELAAKGVTVDDIK